VIPYFRITRNKIRNSIYIYKTYNRCGRNAQRDKTNVTVYIVHKVCTHSRAYIYYTYYVYIMYYVVGDDDNDNNNNE